MTRRLFIRGLLGLILASPLIQYPMGAIVQAKTQLRKVRKSRREWKASLSKGQFYILREEGTEAPYSSPLLGNKQKGTYVCAGCDLPLFTSEMKYNSRTGWPSFTTYIDGSLGTRLDFLFIIPRTEYHCARCEGHQGHIFKDGPPPNYRRYCNNGLALKFLPDTKNPG